MDRSLWHYTGVKGQDHPQEKQMKKDKMLVWGDLKNSWEKKRSERQRRKGKTYPCECRVPQNGTERYETLLQRSIETTRGEKMNEWRKKGRKEGSKEGRKEGRKEKIIDLLKKISDTKGTYHAKMDTIKDRNGMELTEAEDIKKRW